MKKENKNSETLTILKDLNKAYKDFINSPTSENIETFVRISALYTSSWIRDASDESSKQITSEAEADEGFKNLDSNIGNEIKVYTASKSDLLSPMKFDQIDHIKRINIKKYLTKTEIGRAEGESGDIKLITSSTYCPPLKQLQGQDFLYVDHSFRGTIYNEKQDKNLNRRWYVSSECRDEKGELGPKIPWEVLREEFNEIAEEANTKKLFNKDLDDERIVNSKIIYSDDLDLKERKKYFNEITLNDEERKYFMDRDVHFLIFQAEYPKKPDQYVTSIIDADGGESSTVLLTPVWRDVCIFNPDLITFRTFTTDLNFKPKISIPDNREWVMSNDMPNISNQAMREFLKYTHPRMRIIELEDDEHL